MKSRNTDFVFKNWNFSEMCLSLTHYLIENRYSFTEEQIAFLKSKDLDLLSINKDLQALHLKPTLDENYNMHLAIDNLHVTYEAIYNDLKLKLGIFLIDIQAQIDKRETASNPVYLNLLENLKNCCIGTIQGAKKLNMNYKKIWEKVKKLHDLSEKIGVASLPFSQALDPLLGLAIGDDDPFIAARGVCYGDIREWESQVADVGVPNIDRITNIKVYAAQKSFATTKDHKREFICKIDFSAKDFHNNISICLSGYTHSLVLCPPHGGTKHNVGFRIIPETREVEFFDPNFGYFYFQNTQQFTEWLPLLIFEYQKSRIDYDKAFLYLGVEQPDHAVSILSNVKIPKQCQFSTDEIITLIKDFATIYRRNVKKQFTDIVRLENNFVDLCSIYIDRLNPSEDIDKVKEAIQKELPYLKKNTNNLLNFFSADPMTKILNKLDKQKKGPSLSRHVV